MEIEKWPLSSRADVSMDVADEESSALQVSSLTPGEVYAEDAYRYLAERERKNLPKPK